MDYFKLAQIAYKVGSKAGDKIGTHIALSSDEEGWKKAYGEAGYQEIKAAVKRGVPIADAMAAVEQHQRLARQRVQVEQAPAVMGSAKWATWHQLRQANVLHDPDKKLSSPDIFFGAFLNHDPKTRPLDENWLYWSGSSHLMTIAPTGAGKSAVQVIPNLLQYQGSVFVFDPKGELYKATSFHRSQIGKVYRLAPFETNSDAFNPLDGIHTTDDALELAQVIFPQESTGDGAFYEKDARGFLAALLYLIAGQPEDNTMQRVRAFTAMPQDKFRETVASVADNPDFPNFVRHAFDVVRGSDPKVITTLKRSLGEKLQIWDSEAIERVTSRSDFSFEEMKRETVTVYLTVPFHRIEAYSYYVKAMMTMALEAMVAVPERPKIPVLFLLDEFLALGPFPRFVSALRTHRDAGVRLWYFLQSVSDLEAAYPNDWKAFFTATEVKSFFGVRDHYTGELIASLLGNQTLAYTTTNTSENLSNNIGGIGQFGQPTGSTNFGTSTSTQLTGRPLLDAQEVQQFLGNSDPDGTRFGIISLPGQSPVPSINLPWYKGYSNLCRFGCRDNQGNISPVMTDLWPKLNEDFFEGRLTAPLAIEYLDYSMGRDGYAPFNPGLRAMYDSDHNRILFVECCRQVEETYLRVRTVQTDEAQAMADIAFVFMARTLLHEMIHQAAAQLGNAPRDDHGRVFGRYAKEVHARSLVVETGFSFLPPSPATLNQWPMMVPLDTVLGAISAYDGIAVSH